MHVTLCAPVVHEWATVLAFGVISSFRWAGLLKVLYGEDGGEIDVDSVVQPVNCCECGESVLEPESSPPCVCFTDDDRHILCTRHSGRAMPKALARSFGVFHLPGRALGAVEAWVGPQADAKGHRQTHYTCVLTEVRIAKKGLKVLNKPPLSTE